MDSDDSFGQPIVWEPQAPRFRLLHVVISWLIAGVSVFVAAAIVPHVSVGGFLDALIAAALIATLNALLPPIIAALRLPFTLALGFVLVLLVDAGGLVLVSHLDAAAIKVDGFGWALLASVLISAAMVVLEVILRSEEHTSEL